VGFLPDSTLGDGSNIAGAFFSNALLNATTSTNAAGVDGIVVSAAAIERTVAREPPGISLVLASP
jgi:hypothetical protein